MAIVYLQWPPKCVAAFNPIIMIVQTPQGRYAQLEKDLSTATDPAEITKIKAEMAKLEVDKDQTTLDPLTLLVVVGNNEANKTIQIEREADMDGKAEIDLSYILRHAFINSRRMVQPYAEFDYNLMGRYTFIDPDGDQLFSGDVINAVFQLGHNNEGGISGFELLTKTPLIRYVNYPLALSFFQYPWAGYAYRLRDSGVTEIGDMTGTITNIYIAGGSRDFDRLDIIKRDTGALIAQYNIEVGCTPDLPFYVRWINASGGWDYRMFERHEDTSEVGDISNIQRVATNQNDTQQTVSLTATNTVTVGVGLLLNDEYKTVAALARSPRIEWYNEEISTWQTIVLAEDFSATWDSRNAFGTVEFTFALPRVLTQF